jgi:hypothetical protein
MSKLTPEELGQKLRAQAELGAAVREQTRVVTPIVPPPGGPPAEKRRPPGE